MTEVTVDDDVFARGEPFYEDGELAGWYGLEFPPEEDDGRHYNPNRVSDPHLTGTGGAIYADTKGDTTDGWARR